MFSPDRWNGFESLKGTPIGVHFAPGSALTLAPRLCVAVRGLSPSIDLLAK
jgi:hypothetical protein